MLRQYLALFSRSFLTGQALALGVVLRYNMSMAEQDELALEAVSDEVKLQRALRVIECQVAQGMTARDACEACDVPERTYYRWLSEGVLNSWLAECQAGRSKAAEAMAAESLPEIMQYMIGIATGKTTRRGANPIAAAEFVWAKQGKRAGGRGSVRPLAFVPQFIMLNVSGGAVVAGVPEDGEIIDGECVEVSSDGESTPG